MKLAVFDIESDNLLLDITQVYCIAIYDCQTKEEILFGPNDIEQGIRKLQEYDKLIAHNGIMFDIPAIKKLYNVDLPECIDTLLISRLLFADKEGPPLFGNHSLENWGRLLKFPKIEFSDFSEYTEEMGKYCLQDVRLGYKIYQYLYKYMQKYANAIELEHKVAKIIQQQIANGIYVDTNACYALIAEASKRLRDVESQLQEVFPPKYKEYKTPLYYVDPETNTQFLKKGDCTNTKMRKRLVNGPLRRDEIKFNPGSHNDILDGLTAKYDWKPTHLTDGGKEKQRNKEPIELYDYSTSDAVLEELPYPEAALIQEYRLYKKKETQATEWINAIRPDGKIYGNVITNGALTGRMTHSNPNLAQVPRVSNPLGLECRRCFGPRKGWKQVGADAAGLELRMLAHELYPYDKGKYIDVILNGDIHNYNLQFIKEIVDEADRDIAKTFIYGYVYGCGDAKAGVIVKRDAKTGRRLREHFANSIDGLNSLLTKLTRTIDTYNGYLFGLDGRPLRIRKRHALLNTLLQSHGAVVMKLALTLYYEAACQVIGPHGKEWALLLNVHDEFQSECLPKHAELLGKLKVAAIREAGKQLKVHTPLDGEYKIGNNWSECH